MHSFWTVLLGSVALVGQEPPDPASRIPKSHLELEDASMTMIGHMPRPSGPIRKVTWYHESDTGSVEFPEWEKRARFDYDDKGRCVRAEDWTLGIRETLERLQIDPATGTERRVIWSHGSCSAFEQILDTAGRPIAAQFVPLREDGSVESGEPLDVFVTFDRGSRGEVIRCWIPPGERNLAWCREEYWYDPEGRISIVREQGEPGGRVSTAAFEYDDSNRIRAHSQRLEADPQPDRGGGARGIDTSLHRSEYEYDSAGRLVETCTTVDGKLVSTSSCHYAEDGKLAVRSTWTFSSTEAVRFGREPRTEEEFGGDDRPLARRAWDADGRLLRSVRWTYEDDSHGNWTRKTAFEPFRDGGGVAVLREIEYAD